MCDRRDGSLLSLFYLIIKLVYYIVNLCYNLKKYLKGNSSWRNSRIHVHVFYVGGKMK